VGDGVGSGESSDEPHLHTGAQRADEAAVDEDAYPDTDARFPTERRSGEEGQRHGGEEEEQDEEAYPETDAQFGHAGEDDEEEEAYPDTDTQFAPAEPALQQLQPQPTPPQPHQPPPPQPPIALAPSGYVPPAWTHPPDLLPNAAVEEWAGGMLARVVPLAGRRSLVLGRHGGMSDLVVAHASVSRAHAAFLCMADGVYVQDLNSACGSTLDRETKSVAPVAPRVGVPVPNPTLAPLKLDEGDTLRLGDSTRVFRAVGFSVALPEKYSPPVWACVPRKPVQLEVRDTSKPANPYLSHLSADGTATDIELMSVNSHKCYVFGRNAALSDIVVPHASVSRQHCAIVHDEDATYVLDLGSASGTFLNNEDVGPQPRRVQEGQMLTLGSAPMTYTFRFTKAARAGAGGELGGAAGGRRIKRKV
jgi:pSer/pThr/pTyr-binding forkhead associated (FHA) protein